MLGSHDKTNRTNIERFFLQLLSVLGKKMKFPHFFLLSDNVVIYSEKDEYDKLKATPQKTVKRWVTFFFNLIVALSCGMKLHLLGGKLYV